MLSTWTHPLLLLQAAIQEAGPAAVEDAGASLQDAALVQTPADPATALDAAGDSSFWDRLSSFWSYDLTKIDGQPITPGSLIIGISFFLIGLMLSRMLSSMVRQRFLKRVNEGLAAVVQSILFYILLIVFTVSALKVAGIPLTAFTLLGGALAIGVGFGSQNVINNFISGLILLAERPINVGDLIQVQDLYGRVEAIGARSTKIRTGEAIDIVVPNSTFLEQNVVNLSLSGDKVRTKVVVGVAYGSDTKKVTELMMKATKESPRTHKSPEPVIAFTEFGDNSLNFETHFWITMRSVMDRRLAESDVRYRIDELFRGDDVVIAFPQRDVHLDTLSPLRVVVSNDEG